MYLFHNDYNSVCHEAILRRLSREAGKQVNGYGVDDYCASATRKIRALCRNDKLDVHYLVGGTQTNLTVIAATLRPYQGVISAVTGHINVHETGAIEATGHKVIAIPTEDGKLQASQIEENVRLQRDCDDAEHIVQPKMVYISNPTELGTIYKLAELEEISAVCRRLGLYLFMDGARLGYGLTASDNDLTFPDLARLCDVFYIGGTKCGAMFGEAVVISNPAISEDFRYMIKQRGALLAKGWLLGIQFDELMDNNLYLTIAQRANQLADKLRAIFKELGYKSLAETTTNQVFPILPDSVLDRLSESFKFTEMERIDENHRAVRFCTSWATTADSVDALCDMLRQLS